MIWPDTAEELLSAPRGRRLCWSLLDPPGDDPDWTAVWCGAGRGDLAGVLPQLVGVVLRTDTGAIAADGAPGLLAALASAVDLASYWGEPDPEDVALADPAVREALLPVARAAATAPGSTWWPAAADREHQQYVEWDPAQNPATADAAAELAAWRVDTLEDERSAAQRPGDPSASYSGYWWSAPFPSGLLPTTRPAGGLGAVGLALVEDSLGWTQARCWPQRVSPSARVYEVHGPGDWASLAARYPLDVSKSRRHDWWRVTGWAGTWLIPDYGAVAADYDGVHVSVRGYLTTAGRALPAGGARTMLAGWAPDETWWLTDVLTAAGPPARWARTEDDPLAWAPA